MTNPQLNFDHIHYRYKNLKKTRHFYVEIMEAIELSPEFLGGVAHQHYVLGGVNLLFAPAGDDPKPAVPATERRGVYHIAFLVDDCDAATKYYSQRGAKVAKEPFQATENIRASFLQAPDGMWVELKQILPTPPVPAQ
jgi:catechol 2,3-dioxygenase-like lactoylglutathione lyase family enzyme